MAINEELERVKARDQRQKQFWDGLKECDIAIKHGMLTPMLRIHHIFDKLISAFDEGKVITMFDANWATIQYVGSFDMIYSYPAEHLVEDNKGKPKVEKYLAWDTLDEISLTEYLRKSLINYLTAGAALCKKIGSPAYENWIKLLMDLRFECKASNHIFDKHYLYKDFLANIKYAVQRTWADNEAYCHKLK